MHQAAVTVAAPIAMVRHVLLSPLELPNWNPAFRRLTGPQNPTLGDRYQLSVRSRLTGHVWYAASGATHIETRWKVPGLAEDASWDLNAHDRTTMVTHRFQHTGQLTPLLERAFSGVGDRRLGRLAD